MKQAKELLVLGAGNIGRAVVGSMFYNGGYHLTFGDVATALVDTLRNQGRYTVEYVGEVGSTTQTVQGYDVVDMKDSAAVVHAIEATDLVACCVYAGAFADICSRLSEAIRQRKRSSRMLNVLLCVNAMGAPEYFAEALSHALENDRESLRYLHDQTGLCQVLVIRAGIRPSEELRAQDPLTATTTQVGHLYIDKEAFKGHPFDVQDVTFVGNIQALMERKIYTANMTHTMLAFMGWQKGYTLMPQCLADREIRRNGFAAFAESEEALAAQYGFDEADRKHWLENTMKPVDNPNVKDEIARVAANPIEKLAEKDRFAAPARLCEAHGILPFYLARGIAYGYCYDNPDDSQAVELQAEIRAHGIAWAVRKYSGFSEGSRMEQLVLKHYDDIKARE